MSKILGMNLTNTNDTVIPIAGSLYVKTPEALETLLTELRAIGYEIKNLRESEDRQSRGVSVETMEKRGLALWFASLDVRRGKCNSCNGYITTRGIRAHGNTCELCGEVTYYDIIEGSTVRFSFIQRNREEMEMADLKLKVKRWDTVEGFLYFYPEILDGLWLHGDRAQRYLDANKDKWEEITEEGQKLIRIKYPQPWHYDIAAINPSEIQGHYSNHTIVKVWEGKEYPEYFGDFPLRDSISIYESWHWPKHKKSPTLHETILHACGQTADKGWHYQNGSPWFQKGHWESMARFIRHFTELDADAFDKAWPRFRIDGPGGIDDLARFCHGKPIVTDKPNIDGLLRGFSKIAAGEKLAAGEVVALERAAAERPLMDAFQGILKGRRSRSRTRVQK